MIKTHYDTPKNVKFEVKKSMKSWYDAMSEGPINVYFFFTFILVKHQYKQRIS